MRIVPILFTLFITIGQAVFAEAIDYVIVKDRSDIGFIYQFGGKDIKGVFPNYVIDLSLDFERAANSKVKVTLNAATAKAGFIFATQALRSKRVLDTARFPDIIFVSQSVRSLGTGATIKGVITVRGISKPLTLSAQLLRAPGTLSSERENLRIRLSGTINRNDFGASGFPDDVGKMLAIKIDAQIKRK